MASASRRCSWLVGFHLPAMMAIALVIGHSECRSTMISLTRLTCALMANLRESSNQPVSHCQATLRSPSSTAVEHSEEEGDMVRTIVAATAIAVVAGALWIMIHAQEDTIYTSL